MTKIRLGTRGSRLALWQATHVAGVLRQHHPELEVETVIIHTTGDKILDSSLSRIGGKGVFTREIELALLDNTVDVAVHSLKDLPTVAPEGLDNWGICERETPHDLLLSREPVDWKTLGETARIGTSSLRRRAQVRHWNPNVRIEELRGNVPTRIRKMMDGEYDAIILAQAGVKRLGLDAPNMLAIPFDDMLPAPGQGAVALQVRAGDTETMALLRPLHHPESAACCQAERSVLQALGGGCQMPLGTLGVISGGLLRLRARVLSLDGSRCIEGAIEGAPAGAVTLGEQLAGHLLDAGAGEILREISRASGGGFEEAVARSQALGLGPLGGRTVIITRDEDTDGPLSRLLASRGASPLCLPLVRHLPVEDTSHLEKAIARVESYEWLVFASARAVDVFAEFLQRRGRRLGDLQASIACVGPAVARRVEEGGGRVALLPSTASADGLLESFANVEMAGRRVLLPQADRARPTLHMGLVNLGARVDPVVAYRTVESASAATVQEQLARGRADAILFTSPSAVESLAHASSTLHFPRGLVVGSIGPTTTEALHHAGATTSFEATERSFQGLVDALEAHFSKQGT